MFNDVSDEELAKIKAKREKRALMCTMADHRIRKIHGEVYCLDCLEKKDITKRF